MKVWWLSFADDKTGKSLGVALVETDDNQDIGEAIQLAWMFGCNPGGEVMGWQLPAEAVTGIPRWELIRPESFDEFNLKAEKI